MDWVRCGAGRGCFTATATEFSGVPRRRDYGLALFVCSGFGALAHRRVELLLQRA